MSFRSVLSNSATLPPFPYEDSCDQGSANKRGESIAPTAPLFLQPGSLHGHCPGGIGQIALHDLRCLILYKLSLLGTLLLASWAWSVLRSWAWMNRPRSSPTWVSTWWLSWWDWSSICAVWWPSTSLSPARAPSHSSGASCRHGSQPSPHLQGKEVEMEQLKKSDISRRNLLLWLQPIGLVVTWTDVLMPKYSFNFHYLPKYFSPRFCW